MPNVNEIHNKALKEALDKQFLTYMNDWGNETMGFSGLGAAVAAQEGVKLFGPEFIGDKEKQIDFTGVLLIFGLKRNSLRNKMDQNALVAIDAAELIGLLAGRNREILDEYKSDLDLYDIIELVRQKEKPHVAARAGKVLLKLADQGVLNYAEEEKEEIRARIREVSDSTEDVMGVAGLAIAQATETRIGFNDDLSGKKGVLLDVFNQNAAAFQQASKYGTTFFKPEEINPAVAGTQVLALAGAARMLFRMESLTNVKLTPDERRDVARKLETAFLAAAELDEKTGKAVFGVAAVRAADALVLSGRLVEDDDPFAVTQAEEILKGIFARNVKAAKAGTVGMQLSAAARALPAINAVDSIWRQLDL